MTFGNPFGLALYDKRQREVTSSAAQERPAVQPRQAQPATQHQARASTAAEPSAQAAAPASQQDPGLLPLDAATIRTLHGAIRQLPRPLLEALTHEVRTPLATIRTLIRSLLRRADLPALVRQRLQQIDGECSEQIDRFGLIFLAAELQRQPVAAAAEQQPLARTDLARLLGLLEPAWRQQLQRRSLGLGLRIAADLPPVLSDPSRLETVLGGLVDRFSRGLPAGAEVALSLQPAGVRLKLRLSASGTDLPGPEGGREADLPSAERIGPVLSWNPGTGSLQLSRQATQRLFHSLGGRLAERAGNDLTVFFPVAPG